MTIIYQYFEIFVREQVNNAFEVLALKLTICQFNSPLVHCAFFDLFYSPRAKWVAWVRYCSKSPPPLTTVRLNFLSGRLQIVLAQILNNYKIPF